MFDYGGNPMRDTGDGVIVIERGLYVPTSIPHELDFLQILLENAKYGISLLKLFSLVFRSLSGNCLVNSTFDFISHWGVIYCATAVK